MKSLHVLLTLSAMALAAPFMLLGPQARPRRAPVGPPADSHAAPDASLGAPANGGGREAVIPPPLDAKYAESTPADLLAAEREVSNSLCRAASPAFEALYERGEYEVHSTLAGTPLDPARAPAGGAPCLRQLRTVFTGGASVEYRVLAIELDEYPEIEALQAERLWLSDRRSRLTRR